jgi:5-methylcytosine-specific restriction enzyme subunit McrC
MTTLLLTEWQTRPRLSLNVAERDVLADIFGAAVRPTRGLDGHYDVTPSERVGAAVVGGTVVVVQPKIPISRLLFLLEYTADPAAWRGEDAFLGSAPDLVSAMAGLFSRLTERALAQGLLSGYRSVDDYAYAVRGRVDLATQLRRRPGLMLPLAVSYQEFDEDIVENRLLAAAVQLLRPLPVIEPAVRRSLHRIAISLQNVSRPSGRAPEVVWTSLNQHYRPAVELARLLLSHSSIDVTPGQHGASALTLQMPRVFEQFVRGALRRALGADIPAGSAAPALHLDRQTQVKLEPDLSFWERGRCRFVGDVKYKRDWGRGHNDDVYQLLAYATATGLKEATLIYAEGPNPSTTHHVRRTDIALHRHRLDLTAEPAGILRQIDDVADHVLQQIRTW